MVNYYPEGIPKDWDEHAHYQGQAAQAKAQQPANAAEESGQAAGALATALATQSDAQQQVEVTDLEKL